MILTASRLWPSALKFVAARDKCCGKEQKINSVKVLSSFLFSYFLGYKGRLRVGWVWRGRAKKHQKARESGASPMQTSIVTLQNYNHHCRKTFTVLWSLIVIYKVLVEDLPHAKWIRGHEARPYIDQLTHYSGPFEKRPTTECYGGSWIMGQFFDVRSGRSRCGW